jgi:hypothetical protein
MRSIVAFLQIASFIAKYGQPDVAFSFLDLLGTDHTDIISLRDSDDAEESFKLSEITNGVYQNWVNASYVKYQSDFSAGTDGWVMATADSMAGNIDGIGSLNNNFKFTLGTATSSHLTYVSQLVLGQLFEISVDIFIPSSNSLLNGVTINAGTTGIGSETTLDQWTTITGSAVVTVNNRLGMFVTNNGTTSFTGNGTDVVYMRNVITTQKTANGLVKTKYSQGNAVTLQQSAASRMPLLVINGVLQLENGIPIMRRNGVDGGMLMNYDVNDDVARSFFYVGKNPLQNFNLLGSGLSGGASDFGYQAESGGTSTSINTNLTPSDQRLNLAAWSPNTRADVYANLINQFLLVVQCTFNYEETSLGLGYRASSPSGRGMADTQELIIYPGNTDNAEKEAYINAAYSIYTNFIAFFGQPALALDFRDLLGTDPVIIRSMRDSDDLEANFKVSEITDGTLVNWVNEETTLFDEDFSSDPGYSLASGVTISGGKLNFSSAGNNTSSAVYAYGSADFQTVRITVEVTDYVSGRIRANNFSGGVTTSPDIEANGTYVYEVTLGDGGTSWGFGSSTGTTLKVASFKVEQLTANGSIRSFFGQGNSLNAEQTAASSQPIIVNAGTLVTVNGKPALDLRDEKWLITDTVYPTEEYLSSFIVAKTSEADSRIIDTRGVGGGLGNKQGWQIKLKGSITIDDGSGNYLDGANKNNVDQIILTGLMYGGSGSFINEYVNSAQVTAVTLANSIDFDSGTNLTIGTNINGQDSQFFNGFFQSIILYGTNEADKRAAIEANINEYYSIY